jgi:hypothetical protein
LAGKVRQKRIILFFVLFFLIVLSACGRKNGTETQSKSTDFGWKDNVSQADIPDFPVKGNLNGREVQFQYINFERWRGSNDNVINFSLVKPEQNCGFIENFSGFSLINKGDSISTGEFVKAKFSGSAKTYLGICKEEGRKSSAEWNCALKIESKTDKAVTGKIALFFNDEAKSWVAGRFEAIVCNN